ncbi:hypothetical protein GCM10009558_001790 [Virgisporangium aurantiacum]
MVAPAATARETARQLWIRVAVRNAKPDNKPPRAIRQTARASAFHLVRRCPSVRGGVSGPGGTSADVGVMT